MFFDDHPRFLETSTTASQLSRLNWRHRGIIEDNRDLLAGARVLDIASHDGRWSLAALEAGARHVTGIEARDHLVGHSHENMKHYGVDDDRYRFIAGDVFEVLAGEHGIRVDVAMCLGFLYHTIRYPELFRAVRSVGAEHLIIDTNLVVSPNRVVRLVAEDVTVDNNASDGPLGHAGRVLSGWPSATGLEFMLDLFGFDVVKKFDWKAALEARVSSAVGQYRRGARVTWVARAR